MPIDVSVIIPARNEATNLHILLPSLHRTLEAMRVSFEVIVVDGGSTDQTVQTVQALGDRVIRHSRPGYGHALKEGFQAAQGEYLLTMDADLSHEPSFITALWANRRAAEVVIASRYTRGGVAYMPPLRKVLSRVLNTAFAKGLSLDVRDLSSGFRLYRAAALRTIVCEGTDFDVLPEILIRFRVAGWRIAEAPFTYFPRRHGSSQARIIRVGMNLAKTFVRMWRLRNSIEAVDYDERAFNSWIPLQRMWQRRRHQIICAMAQRRGRTLDVGCGSSATLRHLHQAIGLDIRHAKMRYMKRYDLPVVTGSIFRLPFADQSMDCVICSEVIEHVPVDAAIFVELDRVLKAGGLLILGTPDYATLTWPVMERLYRVFAPGGYADEHISHYTRKVLAQLLGAMGYEGLRFQYVFRSELILAARKTGRRAVTPQALEPFLPHAPQQTASSRFGIVMLSSKFYATSDMGGGLEQSACRLSHHLVGAGHRVVVLTRNYDGLPQREMIDGVLVHRFPIWGRSPTTVSLSYLVQSLWWLLRHRREYQIIHCHQSYAPATIGVLAKLLLGKPVLVLIATSDEFSERRELERLPLFRLRRFLLRRVDRFVALNRVARDEFKELGVEPSRILHIANGVPIPQGRAFDASTRQAVRTRLNLPWERIVIFVGRLAAEKNLPTLIEAWPRVLRVHPTAHLLLVGDGGTFRNVEPELRHQVATLGLQESVHFIGRTAEVLNFLLAADVFVLPSSTEGMSNALLEAMACGLPIVATRIPGNAAVITHGENGLLVPAGDAEAFARAITQVLSAPQDALRLAQAARRTAEERFAIGRVAQAYLGLYAELVTR